MKSSNSLRGQMGLRSGRKCLIFFLLACLHFGMVLQICVVPMVFMMKKYI